MKRIICLFLLLTTLIFPNSTDDLFNAIKKLDISRVKTAIEKNANVNAKDSLGNTPLDYIIDDYDLEARSLKETGNRGPVRKMRIYNAKHFFWRFSLNWIKNESLIQFFHILNLIHSFISIEYTLLI